MFLSAFILYPILEIFIFILVAQSTSWETAIGITLATSFIGIVLLRLQRHGPLFNSQELSSRSLKNYLLGNLGAVALVMPGFLSDLFGIILIVPPLRRALSALLKLLRIDLNGNANGVFSVFRAYRFGDHEFSTPYDRYDASECEDEPIDVDSYPSQPRQTLADASSSDDVIDVEFTAKDR